MKTTIKDANGRTIGYVNEVDGKTTAETVGGRPLGKYDSESNILKSAGGKKLASGKDSIGSLFDEE